MHSRGIHGPIAPREPCPIPRHSRIALLVPQGKNPGKRAAFVGYRDISEREVAPVIGTDLLLP